MTGTFTIWDVGEHLRTREDARVYVQACAEEDPGDGSLVRAALNNVARAGNMSSLARDIGMSREGFYKALSEDGNPTFATVRCESRERWACNSVSPRNERRLGLHSPGIGSEF